jgi:hypothetical protein
MAGVSKLADEIVSSLQNKRFCAGLKNQAQGFA